MEDETQMPPCNRLFNGEAVDVHVLAYAFVRLFFGLAFSTSARRFGHATAPSSLALRGRRGAVYPRTTFLPSTHAHFSGKKRRIRLGFASHRTPPQTLPHSFHISSGQHNEASQIIVERKTESTIMKIGNSSPMLQKLLF